MTAPTPTGEVGRAESNRIPGQWPQGVGLAEPGRSVAGGDQGARHRPGVSAPTVLCLVGVFFWFQGIWFPGAPVSGALVSIALALLASRLYRSRGRSDRPAKLVWFGGIAR